MSREARLIFGAAGAAALAVTFLLLIGALTQVEPAPLVARLFSAEFLMRSRTYNSARYLLTLLGFFLTTGFFALVLIYGWHRRFDQWAERSVSRRVPFRAALVAGVLSLTLTLIHLPLSLVRLNLDIAYGLGAPPWPVWAADLLKGTALSLTIGSLLWAGLFWAIRRWPQGWWPAATVGYAVYILLTSTLGPVLIDPLFYQFRPLADPALVEQVRTLAERAGVPVDQVLVADASRRTERVNAYVTGFGPTQRIVLYDTLLRYDPRSVRLVVAHELGHWRLGHLFWGPLLSTLTGALGFWLAQRLLSGLQERPGSAAQVAWLMLFFTLLSLATLPVENGISRHMERQADRFALQLTTDREHAVRLMVSLARDNLADVAPHPLTVAILFSHPPVHERPQIAPEEAPR